MIELANEPKMIKNKTLTINLSIIEPLQPGSMSIPPLLMQKGRGRKGQERRDGKGQCRENKGKGRERKGRGKGRNEKGMGRKGKGRKRKGREEEDGKEKDGKRRGERHVNKSKKVKVK